MKIFYFVYLYIFQALKLCDLAYYTYQLRILTIDHVSSNSRQIELNSHILANCRPNSRIEKIEIDGF